MTSHRIGTREDWVAASAELLKREKELTRMGNELTRQRRELPAGAGCFVGLIGRCALSHRCTPRPTVPFRGVNGSARLCGCGAFDAAPADSRSAFG
jgi:hypothetical protein